MAEIEFTVDAERYHVVEEAISGLFKIRRLADRARADALERDSADIHIFCELIMRLAKEHGHALDHRFGTMVGCFDEGKEEATRE